MKNAFYQLDLISIRDLSKEQILQIMAVAKQFKENQPHDLLKHKIIASCFFEPSTRTRLSFEAAALKLGAQLIGFSDAENTSIKKGETLHDTIKMIEGYADLIVIRHYREGAARLAAEVSTIPVINAGDAANQHPTQALLDLFSIQETQGTLDDLSVAIVGDLKYGRTVHSLAQACAYFNIRLYLVSPSSLSLPVFVTDVLKENGIKFSLHQSIDEIINKIDILYMTRIQKERLETEKVSLLENNYSLKLSMLDNAKPNLRVLHPLPRVDELAVDVDHSPYGYYFEQAKNGIWVRQALLSLLLCEEL